jgi:hypothetical protein
MNNTPLVSIPTYTAPIQEMLMQKSLEINVPFARVVSAFLAAGEDRALFEKAVRVSQAMGINLVRVAQRLKTWSDAGEMTMASVMHLFPEAELQWEQKSALFHALFDQEEGHA